MYRILSVDKVNFRRNRVDFAVRVFLVYFYDKIKNPETLEMKNSFKRKEEEQEW